jgi:hypothetical protein
VRGAKYEFLAHDLDRLRGLVGSLVSGPQAEQVWLALRRFDAAYERARAEDKLIDYWVALEALFLKGSEQQELSYRAALRIARFLGEGAEQRVELFKTMKRSYGVRSRVVHGELPKADAGQVASDTEEILRRALRAEVTNPGSLNVDRLDAAIARGGNPEQERTLE